MWYFAADIEQQVIGRSVKTVAIATAVLLVCTIIALLANKFLKAKQFNKLKVPLFVGMAGAALVGTAMLTYNTIYLNVVSESKGPVHWHADIEFWACGSEIELRNPTGFLSNKVGTSTYHEHNDKRIHLEGVVVNKKHDASLGKFMEVTGGYINEQGIGMPLSKDQTKWLATKDHHDGDKQSIQFKEMMANYVGEDKKGPVLDLRNRSLACGDKNAQAQVFVYTFDKETKSYSQKKLTNPADFVIRDESIVPPGDCIIVEFDKPKKATDKLCEQYGVRDSVRCEEYGVKKRDPELCNIRYEGVQ